MTEYTPIPWKVSDARTIDDEAMIVGGEGQDFGLIAVVTVDDDAPRIVKAVNSYDGLEAIRKAAHDYFMCAVQDEAEEREVCVDDRQHELAKALRDALRSHAVVGGSR